MNPPPKANTRLRNAVIVFGIVAACWALAGAVISNALFDRSGSAPVAGGLTTTGTVVSVRDLFNKTGPDYVARIAFTTASGDRMTFASPDLTHRPNIGDRARVSYNPADPAGAHDLSAGQVPWVENFVLGILAAVIGTAILAIYAGLGISNRRHPPTAGATP